MTIVPFFVQLYIIYGLLRALAIDYKTKSNLFYTQNTNLNLFNIVKFLYISIFEFLFFFQPYKHKTIEAFTLR